MTVIKKIIGWIIELFRSFFGKKQKVKKGKKTEYKKSIYKKGSKANINGEFNESLPSYMIISDNDKEKLIYSITLMKNALIEASDRVKEIESNNLIKIIQDSYNIKVNELLDKSDLESLIKDLNSDDKKSIINKYQSILDQNKEFKVHINEIDKVINKINRNKISIITESELENKINDVTSDKNLDIDNKVDKFIKDASDIIEDIDEYFLNDVVREYKKVNYVTVTTMLIDKNYEKLKKLQDDFKNHKYNKYYYEREINKIKQELNKIKNLKTKKEVSDHIALLKKELYTKSKDKYDLLYNNEVFLNINKECDILLEKANAKVIDIKESKKEETKKEKKEKENYIENILKRFQDMDLARKLILLAMEEDEELVKQDDFITQIYNRFNDGVKEEFNFSSNKKRTELVILYNELNMAIGKKTKETFPVVEHINFKVDDLVEAVEVKKDELKKLVNPKESMEEDKTDSKIKTITYPKKNK